MKTSGNVAVCAAGALLIHAIAGCGGSAETTETTSGTGGATTGSSTTSAGAGGSETTTASSSTGAGGAGGAMVVCPTAPPVDTDDPAIREECTKPVYIAGGDNFHLLLSDDKGATWKSFSVNDQPGDDFVNHILVAKGVITVIAKPGFYSSVDGGATFNVVEQVKHTGFNTYGGQMNFGGGAFLLTDNEGTYTSKDGIDWQRIVPFPDMSHPDGFGGHHHGIAHGNGTDVVFQDNAAFRTFDGAAWAQDVLTGTGTDVRSVVFGNNLFLANGSDDVGVFTTTSGDGKTWGARIYKDSADVKLPTLSNAIFDGATFQLFTRNSSDGFTSADGVAWTKIKRSQTVSPGAYQDGAYFGIGGGKLVVSTDGLAWTGVHDFAVDETFKINGSRIAMGYVLK